MSGKNNGEHPHLSILDAVEALADIADMEFDKEVSLAHQDELNEQNQKVMSQAVKSLDLIKEDPDSTVRGIRETFHVVLKYLQEFYQDEYRHMGSERALEGVKEIMMIAGEAAKKLDRYTTIFTRAQEKSVVELKEYKQLQEFFRSKIARKIDQGILGKWILELTKGAMNRNEEVRLERKRENRTRHVFIDMESVKKDTDYDLFFMKKEDGARFFNPRLIRNIKLVCDFGGRLSDTQQIDLFESISLWEDKVIMESARNILQSLGAILDRYYKETHAHSEWMIVKNLNKALMALYLAGNERNLMKNVPPKCCFEYFTDFQKFLRETLHSNDYQKWIAYPPKRGQREAKAILDMIHGVCRGLIVSVQGCQAFIPTLDVILSEAAELLPLKKKNVKLKTLHKSLLQDYDSMGRLMRMHPNGPLIRVLNILGKGIFRAFDPLSLHNIPTQLYSIYERENKRMLIPIVVVMTCSSRS